MKNLLINRLLLITALLGLMSLPACGCNNEIGIIEQQDEWGREGGCMDQGLEPEACCDYICLERCPDLYLGSLCEDLNSGSECDEDDPCQCCLTSDYSNCLFNM
jgi:hypothetical protein